jgi:RHS repeat-associated protein
MRNRIPHWLRFLAPRCWSKSRHLGLAKGRPAVLPTRPVLEFLEGREMPGDVLGGFFISALGVLPYRDPLAAVEIALNETPNQVAVPSQAPLAGESTVPFKDGASPLDNISEPDQFRPDQPPAGGSSGGLGSSTPANDSPLAFSFQSHDQDDAGLVSLESGMQAGLDNLAPGSSTKGPSSSLSAGSGVASGNSTDSTSPSGTGSVGFGVAPTNSTSGSSGSMSGLTNSNQGGGTSSGLSDLPPPVLKTSPSKLSGAAPLVSGAITVSGQTLNLVEGTANTNIQVATFTDSDGNTSSTKYTATINWGDGATSAGTVSGTGGPPPAPGVHSAPGGPFAVCCGFIVTGSHTYAEEGTYTTTITINDTDGDTGAGTGKAIVADAALAAGTATPVHAMAGSIFTSPVANFTDADPAGTVSDYSASIAWGDGTTSTGKISAGTGGSFVVSGSHRYTLPGSYTVASTIKDVGGSSVVVHNTVTVTSPTHLTLSGTSLKLTEGTATASQVVASFSDADGGPASSYTASITWGDGQTSTGTVAAGSMASQFTVSAAHTYAEEGTFAITVTVTDNDATHSKASVTSTAYVADAALTPGSNSGNLTATVGTAFSGALGTFTDADTGGVVGDYTVLIKWGDNSAPTVGTVTGTTTFTVSGTHKYEKAGTFTVAATVTDSGGARTTITRTMVVSAAALTMTAASFTLVEGASGSATVATFTDPDGNTTNAGVYSASIDWGDGNNSSGTVTTNTGGSFKVTGTHTYAEEGTFAVNVTVNDSAPPSAVSASIQSTATVSDAALTLTASPITAHQDREFSGDLGSFTDADPGGTESDYTAEINWGDGAVPGPGDITPKTGGGFWVQGAHIYATTGTFTITITLKDAGGATATATTTATVTQPNPSVTVNNLTVTEGQSFSGAIGTLLPGSPDPGISAFTVDIGWGDGVETSGTLASNGSGGYTISGTHIYAEETGPDDPYELTVSVDSTATGWMDGVGSTTVNDASLSATGLTLNGWTNTSTGTISVGDFHDANTEAPVTDFTASINWGDGSQATTGTVQPGTGGGNFLVEGSHTYTAAGTYTIQTTVTDDGGATTTISSTMTIAAPTTSLTAIEYTSFNGVVSTFTGNPAQATSANIDWGDGTNSAGTITSTGQNSFTVSGNHTYGDETNDAARNGAGPYTLKVTVQMSVGGPLTDQGPATVNDAALSGTGLNFTAVPGQPLGSGEQTTIATFTDANPQASLGDFTATIDWGDGTTSAGAVQTNGSGGFQVLGNHTYDADGIYAIKTTVLDDGGSTVTLTGTATVNSVYEGQDYTLVTSIAAPNSSDTPETDYFAYINWGDGSAPEWGTVTPLTDSSGNLTSLQVTADHVYYEEATYNISITIYDANANPTTATNVSVTILDAPLVAGPDTTLNAVKGESTGNVVIGTFTDTNPGAAQYDFNSANPSSDYTVTINWGDGSAQGTGTVQEAMVDGYPADGFQVLGSHTYATAGLFTIQYTVTDDGGQYTTGTATADVMGAWSLDTNDSGARSNDPSGVFLLPIGEATVDLNQGALRLSHGLDFDQSPGTDVGGNPALIYNSATVNVRPVIQLAVQSDPNGTMATQAQVQLTWNGTAQSPVTYSLSGYQPGEEIDLSAEVTSPVTTSGAYPWSVTITLTFPNNSTIQLTDSGTKYVVARDASPYGAGWWIDGVPQLLIGSPGVLMEFGSGDSRFFASAGGSNFTSPPEDFGTLGQNGDGSYTYVAKDKMKWNFNSSGQLTSVVDTHGLARQYAYDSNGRLYQVLAIDSGLTTLTYDSSGLLQNIQEPGSNRNVQVQHDGAGNLSQITDVDLTTRTFGYDSAHHLTNDIWAPLNAIFTYDPNTGLLTGVNRGLGTTYSIVSAAQEGLGSANAGPEWARVTDALNHTTDYLLDERGRLLQQILPGGETTTYYRDQEGQVTEMIDPLDLVTDYIYSYGSGDGDLVEVINSDDTTNFYQYDPTFHHLTESIDGDGVISAYNTYDPTTGDLLSSTDAMGNTVHYTWSAGLLQTVKDARGLTSEYFYDGERRQVAALDNLGLPTFYYYDLNGNPYATQDAIYRVNYTIYSPRNLLLETVDAEDAPTFDSYNAYGEQTAEMNARGYTRTTTYDQRGFVTSATDWMGNPSNSFYDAAGNLVRSQDADGNNTYYGYDVDNRQVQVQDAQGGLTTTYYDGDSNVRAVTDALQRTTYNFYDDANRLVLTIDPMLRTTRTFYDKVGDVIRTTDAEGISTDTFYDWDRRPYAVRDGRGLVSYTDYDQNGNVVETVDPLGMATYTAYDADNRPFVTEDPQKLFTWTGYDDAGNAVVSVDGRDKITQTYYDLDNRPVATIDPDNNVTETYYDEVGNVYATVDARNHVAYNLLDGDNRVIVHQDEDGYLSGATFDAAGNETSTTDNNLQTTYNWFDSLNREFLSVDPDWQVSLTGYNAVGDQTISVDGAGDISYDAYDGDNEEAGSQDPTGAITYDFYTADGQLALSINPDLVATQYIYDADGNQLATVDGLGLPTVNLYDGDNRNFATIDALGQATISSFDNDGRVIQQTLYNKSGVAVAAQQMSYDGDGNLTQTVDADGNTTVNTFDNAGFKVLTQTFAAGTQALVASEGYQYDGNGDITRTTDADGNYVQDTYDSDGRLTLEQQYAANGTLISQTSDQYDGDGNLAQFTDGVGNVTKDTYNGEGQVLTEQIFAPGATLPSSTSSNSYDGAGRVSTTVDGDGNYTVNTYDNDGREINQKLYSPGNVLIASTSNSYTPGGALASSTDANGNVTAYTYNADYWQLAVTVGYGTAAAATTQYGYDLDGQLVAILDPDLNLTQYTRDAEGNIVATTDNFGFSTTRTFDANGNLTSETNRNGLKRTMTYDGAGRLLTETWYAANGTTVVNTKSYTYDTAGNLLSAGDTVSGTYHYTYDGENRVQTQTDPNGVTLTYGYDGDGNVTSVADSLGGTVTSFYDSLGNLTSRRLSGTTQARVDMTYDANSNLLTVARYADAAGTQLKGSSTLTYDNENNLKTLTHKNAANTTLASYTYNYDAGARLTSEVDNGTSTSYGYDATNQITSAGSTSYAWDPNGNTKATGVVIGFNNQLWADGTWNYIYDHEGNLIQKIGISNGLIWNYGYNDVNQMTSAVEKSGSTTLVSATYVYDVFGNRLQSSVTQNGTTTVTHYAYNGSTLWADLTSANALQTRYLSGDGPDQWLARIDSTGTSWLLTDHLGSIRDVMNSSGSVIDHINYDAFGLITSETSPSNGGRLKYAGYESDSALGLYHAGARYYDPVSHRWMKEDPLGFAAGDSNLDRYVGNGPTNGTDPRGELFLSKKGNEDWWTNYLRDNYGITGWWALQDPGVFKANRWGFVIDEASRIKAAKLIPEGGDDPNLFKALNDTMGNYNVEGGDGNFWSTSVNEGERESLHYWYLNTQDEKNGHTTAVPGQEPSAASELTNAFGEGLAFGLAAEVKGASGGNVDWANSYVNEHKEEYGETTRLISEGAGIVAREALIGAATAGAGGLAAKGALKGAGAAAEALQLSENTVCAVRTTANVIGVGGKVFFTAEQLIGLEGKAERAYTAFKEGKDEEGTQALAEVIAGVPGLAFDIKDVAAMGKQLVQLGPKGFLQTLVSCFAAGTPFLTPDGHKRIEDFKPGDLILSRSEFDPTGPVEVKIVEDVFVRTGRILHLHVGGQVIRTTAEHPFFEYNRGWLAVAELQIGDLLLSHDGTIIPIEDLFDTEEYERVYNLRVAQFHTYFIGIPDWRFSIWAHNADCQVQENYKAGKTREDKVAAELAKENPGASVQRERYLRDSEGNRLVDPLTNEARRVDMAVVKDKKVLDMVEVTSKTAPKADQFAKEERIRELGDVFIRDRQTKELLPVNDIETRLVRKE